MDGENLDFQYTNSNVKITKGNPRNVYTKMIYNCAIICIFDEFLHPHWCWYMNEKKILNYHLQACKIKYKKKCKPDYQFGEVCDNFPYDVSIGDVSK